MKDICLIKLSCRDYINKEVKSIKIPFTNYYLTYGTPVVYFKDKNSYYYGANKNYYLFISTVKEWNKSSLEV